MLRHFNTIILKTGRQALRNCSTEGKITEIPEIKNILVQKLTQEFGDISDVLPITEDERYKNIPLEEWKNRIYMLKGHGLTDTDCFQIIKKHPSLLRVPQEDLRESIAFWCSLNLGLEKLQSLLTRRPFFLELEPDVIHEKMPLLHAMCRSKTSLVSLLLNCPNIMFDDWTYTQKKINFLMEEKKLKWGDLLQSRALSKSLNFLKIRFEILEKCGVYKVKEKSDKHEKYKVKNPNLRKVVDLSNKEFIKIAQITLEEYAAYKELFSLEENLEEDSDNEDLSESYKK